jgi:hypothetical protein
MLETMFEDEDRLKTDFCENLAYLRNREEIVERLFVMGAKFK